MALVVRSILNLEYWFLTKRGIFEILANLYHIIRTFVLDIFFIFGSEWLFWITKANKPLESLWGRGKQNSLKLSKDLNSKTNILKSNRSRYESKMKNSIGSVVCDIWSDKQTNKNNSLYHNSFMCFFRLIKILIYAIVYIITLVYP